MSVYARFNIPDDTRQLSAMLSRELGRFTETRRSARVTRSPMRIASKAEQVRVFGKMTTTPTPARSLR